MDVCVCVCVYNLIPFAATWMDLEIIIVSKVSQKEKDKYHMILLICGISNVTWMNLPTKWKQTHRHREDLRLPREKGWERWMVGVSRCKVTQSCQTLCDPVDCSLPGSSVREIFQARVLEWVAISFSRGSSWLRDWTRISCIADRCFTIWATR